VNTDLERDLTDTLARAADRAPAPDRGFIDAVRHRQRTRTRRRTTALAACATALMIIAGLGAVRLATSPDAETPANPTRSWSGTVPDLDSAPAPDKVWPGAVHQLPAKLPNGSEYQVYSVLGNDRYLIQIFGSDYWAPWLFDEASGALTYLGNDTRPKGNEPSGLGWAVATGEYAVWSSSIIGPYALPNLWVARLDGSGEPYQVNPKASGAFSNQMFGVTNDAVYWRTDNAGSTMEIFRQPLSGGPPKKVEETDEFAVSGVSPWLVTPRPVRSRTGGLSMPEAGELWNPETGERRHWRNEAKLSLFACGPLACTGKTAQGRHVVQRLDGTGLKELPIPRDGFTPATPIGGRFSVGIADTKRGKVLYAWDLVTGKAGTVTAKSSGSVQIGQPDFYAGYEYSVLQWPVDSQTIYVLDLKAIE
jgi:hypothetical protein